MRWSNAGHPPPILVHLDGVIETLENEKIDPLLGFDIRADRKRPRRSR
ncbi:SpoIIE family protein phosphatase [Frankia sp. CNm7]|uniref:SpoIIE family protein phosphatase n=1 Tax=Frankia nepalensis TaxID=1836974 RepID=A0A937RKY7_9ACTN|nr:SpoIIE family protein phosphatase [Frankia nepalensis]MBL7511511.1 SpoIIE family protein phosphatase [Frankia nepalensis]MBL7520727.1 SpoIIE family protein phosphatase [Frankia nepalensis]MBL7630754.1 SpoIIE family protein phosphatase [Frankia nepalensis]